MGLTRVDRMGESARLLRQSPAEVTALVDDLVIHVTGFFRDPEAWDALRRVVIAPLVQAREPGRVGPRLGDGLLQRRGGLHAGHAPGGGIRAGRQAAGHQGLRHRPGQGSGVKPRVQPGVHGYRPDLGYPIANRRCPCDSKRPCI
jgi:hypothetical protein